MIITLPIQYLIVTLEGYLLGCSNMAFYLAKAKGVDLRAGGSGNLGTSNATILLGKRAGALTLVHDLLKATIAVLIARYFFPETALVGEILAGTMSILGHMYPFWLKFRGGKGFASYLGCILGLDWRFFLLMVLVVVLAILITDLMVSATFSTILGTPIWLVVTHQVYGACIIGIASVCILWKHRENIVRILRKEEIGVRRGLSGKDKIK